MCIHTNKELDAFFLGGYMDVYREAIFGVSHIESNQIHFCCMVTINPVLFMRSHHKFTFQSHKKNIIVNHQSVCKLSLRKINSGSLPSI